MAFQSVQRLVQYCTASESGTKGTHMGHEPPMKQRLHITFGKFDALRYTGNLDTAKLWERVLRRADLPLLYSQGFNTHPRIQLATALPLGITSECEIIDVSLRERITIAADLTERLLAVSPAGLRIYKIVEVPVRTPPLQSRVRSAEYRIAFPDGIDRDLLQARIDYILAQDRIIQVKIRKRRKSITDLRTLIYTLEIDENGALIAHIAAGEQGNIRPDDLIEQLDLGDIYYNAHRYALHIEEYR